MSALRVSVTDVDSYRYYCGSDKPLDELLAELRREAQPTPAMESGRAFHKMLEHAAEGEEISEFEADGYTFEFACDAELSLPPVRELKGEATIDVDGVDVTLVGKVDGIDGMRLWDHKPTTQFDVDKWADAFQWRAYLWMFACNRLTYNVFVRSIKGSHVRVREVHTLDFYRYPDMEWDMRSALRDFVAFARTHLPERFTESA